MENLNMFCITMNSNHLSFIKEINYTPVGLGEEKFSKEWFSDNTGNHISKKNQFYGEYTFHYWIWKNYLDKLNEGWIGFCQYRKFWSIENKNLLPDSLSQLKSLVLSKIPKTYENVDVILGEEYFIDQLKLMKFLKKGSKIILKKPSYLFNKKKRNIKFHFDLMHGEKNLDRAIQLLDDDNREDFKNFVSTKNAFNPHNMFMCRSKKILNNYYTSIFPWLEKCEKIFGFNSLAKWDEIRIYTFLAERYMSYWFQKNTKYKTMPIIFYDIRKDFNYKP